METDERRTRIREVRRQLVREGPPWTRGYERDFDRVTTPDPDCDRRHPPTRFTYVCAVGTVGADPKAEPVTRGRALRLPDPSFEPPF